MDGVGTVDAVAEEGFARVVRIDAEPGLLRYVVEKGSIAVDGVSLTVAAVDEASLLGLADPRDAREHHPRRPRAGPRGEPGGGRARQVRGEAAAVSDAPFSTIEDALEDVRAGRMVVVCDAEDRENEGDLTLAAQFATPEAVNFMAKEGRGLICLALTPERCDELGLDLMAAKNESPFQTAFTVSIEAREGISTGISAHDRARTIQVAIDPRSRPQDLVQPGHIFPLKAKAGGRARAHRPDRGRDRPRAPGRAHARRRDLRGDERRRHDGPRPRPRALLRPARPEDDHGVRPDRLPAPPRQAGRARGGDGAAHRVRRVRRGGLSHDGRRQAPRGDGQGRGRRRGGRAGARALRVPHRRRLPLAALRLRPAARGRAAADRGGGPRRAALPRPGGTRHRPAEQAEGLQAPGGGRWTPSTPTSSWACPPTCATTASAPRSWWTSA